MIMEKKEAIKILKDFHDKSALFSVRTALETLHPELKESEDERIRKFLIKWIQDNYYHGTTEIPTKTLIAWLEKQGQEPMKVSIWKHWKGGICGNGEGRLIYLIKNGDNYSLSSVLGFECDYIELSDLDNLMLENQGTSYTKNDVDDAYLKGISDTKNEFEKQGEPSIKWNKNTEGNKPQVNHSVLMKTTYGIAEGEWKGEYWEQYRWAGIVRDSDVLSWMELSDLDKQGEQKPTLRERYKNIAESEWFKKTHDGMSVSDDEKVDNINKIEPKFKVGNIIRLKDGDGLEWTVEEVLNNGYYTIVCADRDDFIQLDDKWELVEQKPAWSDDKKLTDVNHEYFSELLENNDSEDINDYAYQVAYCMSHDWIEETATWDDVQKACKLGAEWKEKHWNNSSTAWSEEDEEHYQACLQYFDAVNPDMVYYKDYQWLKSLKERIGE